MGGGHDDFEQTLESVRQETISNLQKFRSRNIRANSLFGRIELLLNDYFALRYLQGLKKREEDMAYIRRARDFSYDLQINYL